MLENPWMVQMTEGSDRDRILREQKHETGKNQGPMAARQRPEQKGKITSKERGPIFRKKQPMMSDRWAWWFPTGKSLESPRRQVTGHECQKLSSLFKSLGWDNPS